MWKPTILFDLDGTLTDPREGITRAVQYALASFGIREENLDRLCPFIGPPLFDSFQEFYGFGEEQARRAILEFQTYFKRQGMFENRVYEGMEQMLEDLKKTGVRLAVATSKPEPFAKQILEHFGLSGYFERVCGANLDETRGRKGEVIAYALEELGLQKAERPDWRSEVLMVGDRKHDVLGAHEHGIPCVGVLYGYGSRAELEAAEAEFLMENVKMLGTFLEKWSFHACSAFAGQGVSR